MTSCQRNSRWIWVGWLSGLLLVGVAFGEVELTLATYNLQNFFDAHDDPYTADEGTVPKPFPSQQALAVVIRDLGAEVIGLQEVENRGVLEAFNREHLGGLYPTVVLVEGNDRRGIDVALLSKLPVLSVTNYCHRVLPTPQPNFPNRFARDLLAVRLQATTKCELTVYVVHLKSKHGGRESDLWRRAEAQQVRAIVEAHLRREPQAYLVLLGDLNDLPSSEPLEPLLRAGSPLFDPAAALPGEQTYTYTYGERQQRIDYLLLSPALRRAYVPGSLRVVRTPAATVASDHFPVSVRVRLPGERVPPPAPPCLELPQVVAARRGKMGFITREDATYRRALTATDLETLRAHLGQRVIVKGRLVAIHRPESGRVWHLNFSPDYQQALSGVIFAPAFELFPDLGRLVGQELVLTGELSEYRGRLQIILYGPGQVQVVKE